MDESQAKPKPSAHNTSETFVYIIFVEAERKTQGQQP